MKQFIIALLTALVTVAISYICSFAQSSTGTVVKQIGGPGQLEGEPYSLGELGAIIGQDSTGLRVMFIGPREARPKTYQDIDLKQDDLILMMNGKRLTSTADLSKAIDSLKIGDNIQLGLKRDGQLMVVSFPKADPTSLPKRQMMVMKSDGGKGDTKIKLGGKDLRIPDGIKGIEPVPGLGILIGTKDNKVVVAAVLPFMQENPGLKALVGGDQILSVSDKPVNAPADFIAAFTAVKVGEKFTFKVLHAGKEAIISIIRSEDHGTRVIERK
jgi:S1-C subfamily serine protease